MQHYIWRLNALVKITVLTTLCSEIALLQNNNVVGWTAQAKLKSTNLKNVPLFLNLLREVHNKKLNGDKNSASCTQK